MTFEGLKTLELLHEINILHRNINPSNLMKRANNDLVLISYSQAIKIKNLIDSSFLVEDHIPKGGLGYLPFISLHAHKTNKL